MESEGKVKAKRATGERRERSCFGSGVNVERERRKKHERGKKM